MARIEIVEADITKLQIDPILTTTADEHVTVSLLRTGNCPF